MNTQKIFLLLLILILIFSCKTNKETIKIDRLKIYKDLGNVQRYSDITISSFWAFKSTDIDSAYIENIVTLELIEKCINSMNSNRKKVVYMNPKYAFIIINKKNTDTLYMDEYLKRGYYKNLHLEIEDKKELLKTELEKANSDFFKR